jgi:transcriptional regulator with XRE-family HTH domain
MEPIDKAAMGRRVKQIRLEAGLRQWQLAEMLGTTQSAVHKYEHGVTPEPRRLVELARVGRTTVEWILTGQHWEDGDQGRERLPSEVYRIARMAASLSPERLRALRDAMEILDRAAREAARSNDFSPEDVDSGHLCSALQGLASSRKAMNAILRLHRVVVNAALDVETRRFEDISGNSGRPV